MSVPSYIITHTNKKYIDKYKNHDVKKTQLSLMSLHLYLVIHDCHVN